MFALLNQNHGSENSVLWNVSQCGRPKVCSVHSSVVHNNVVLPHCKVRAQPTVWLSSARWAWNRSRWGERACELPRFTLEPSQKYWNLLQTPNVLYFVEPYQVHWNVLPCLNCNGRQFTALYPRFTHHHLDLHCRLIADFSTRIAHSIKQNTRVAKISGSHKTLKRILQSKSCAVYCLLK